MSFWGELRRRNVFKVGVAYLVVAWLLVQVTDIVLPTFDAPEWAARTITFVLLLGFPVVLIIAWAFEITPQGIRKSHHVPLEESITHLTGQRLNYVVTALLAVAVVVLVIDNYVLEDSAGDASAPATIDSSAPVDVPSPSAAANAQASGALPNSIAVLPLENLSPDPDNAYFAAGMHEEIINQLAKLKNLNVISRTTMLQYAERQESLPEIARELNVETVIEGSVRYADERVLVTLQLIDPETDVHLWAGSYPGDLSDIFAIQADIAMSVANALEVEFTPAEQRSIEQVPTESLDAYELYLSARVLLRPVTFENHERSMRQIDRALALDPEFALAWAFKARLLLLGRLNPGFDPRDASEIQADAERAARRAVELDSSSGSSHLALASAASWRADWLTAEAEYTAALELGEEIGDYGVFLLAVGKAGRATDYLRRVRQRDPLDDSTSGFLAAALDSVGDLPAAMAEYERGLEVFDPWLTGILNRIVTQIPSDGFAVIGAPWVPNWMRRDLFPDADPADVLSPR
jgi:TolB-like protein